MLVVPSIDFIPFDHYDYLLVNSSGQPVGSVWGDLKSVASILVSLFNDATISYL